jgi:hypothetical protein
VMSPNRRSSSDPRERVAHRGDRLDRCVGVHAL